MDFETFGGDGIVSRRDDPVQAWCDDDLRAAARRLFCVRGGSGLKSNEMAVGAAFQWGVETALGGNRVRGGRSPGACPSPTGFAPVGADEAPGCGVAEAVDARVKAATRKKKEKAQQARAAKAVVTGGGTAGGVRASGGGRAGDAAAGLRSVGSAKAAEAAANDAASDVSAAKARCAESAAMEAVDAGGDGGAAATGCARARAGGSAGSGSAGSGNAAAAAGELRGMEQAGWSELSELTAGSAKAVAVEAVGDAAAAGLGAEAAVVVVPAADGFGAEAACAQAAAAARDVGAAGTGVLAAEDFATAAEGAQTLVSAGAADSDGRNCEEAAAAKADL